MTNTIYYLYTLSHNNKVFYIGITKQLELRYQQHCTGSPGTPTCEYIYWIIQDGERPDMNIINHYGTKGAALLAEYTLLRYFISISHKVCNRYPNPICNRIITCRPPYTNRKHISKNNYTIFISEKLKSYHKWLAKTLIHPNGSLNNH
jgi:predicted GIY-YIG superfamily endonuclease